MDDNDIDDTLDLDPDGEDEDEGEDQSTTPVVLPPQTSATDTSNWDGRVFTAPDRREHIKFVDDTASK